MKKLLAATSLVLVCLALMGTLAVLLYLPKPVRHTVVRGDTLGAIAATHGVSVDELRAWNDLEGDLIEVDQVLVVWLPTETATVAAAARPAKKGVAGAVLGGSTGAVRSALVRPSEKACLAAPAASDLTTDEGWVSSQGLSYEQIASSMKGFVGHTLSCVPEGTAPAGTLQTEITVACTGVVSHVEVLDDGDLPAEMVDCVVETLGYAPFPAHDLPDGETFGYPLTYSF